MQQVHVLQESILNRGLGMEKNALFKNREGNTTQSNKTLPTFTDDALPPAALLTGRVGWQTGEQCCQQE